MTGTTITARVVVDFADEAAADAARRALAPENEKVLAARIRGKELVLEAGPAAIGSLLVTLEDAFACLVAATGSLAAAEDE